MRPCKFLKSFKFDDEKRKKLRKRYKWNICIDFFFTSESTDYAKLRFIVNLFIGFFLSIGSYYLVWKNINFAIEYHKVSSIILKWIVIIGNTLAFAYSKSYRCGLWIFVLGVFGTSGQTLLSIFVFDNVRAGPIDNIITNFKIATDNVVCGVKISTELASARRKTLIGPMRETLKDTLTKILELKGDFSFVDQKEVKESDDEKLDRMIDQSALDLAQRTNMLNEDNRTVTFRKPFYTKFKEKFVRDMGKKMEQQCTQIFDKGSLICSQAFAALKEQCQQQAPFLLSTLICKPLDALDICEDDKRKEQGYDVCNSVLGKNSPQDFEQESIDMRSISKQIAEEMETKIRVVSVEAPRVASALHIKTLEARILHLMRLAKEVVKSLQSVLAALLVLVIYLDFDKAFKMSDAYTNDLGFENRSITSAFGKIDHERETRNQKTLPFIGKLSSLEKRQLRITSQYFRFPKWKELKQFWLPVSKFVTLCVVIVDGVPKGVKSMQLPTLHLNVTGVGIFPKMLRKLFQLKNETVQPIFVLDDCLLKPSLPDYDIYVGTIFLPLLFMFFSQILLAFLPKRVILFCFLPYMFPRKARARVIWLYNLCLKHRLIAREEARRRIAFFVKWRKERKEEKDEEDEDDDDLYFCFAKNSLIRRVIVDNLYRPFECFLCQTYLRAWQTHKCEQCPATYCKLCWTELTEKCYACQVEHQEAAIDP
ncbi:unnamed protein product, partial [Mesorhabditis belari]|uniref:Dendritic cell-specific transmembrane protein-like domain-containing protein n=1 Tax=Mesorhabditis belari TaxID=2138241 RepID=A0AAF3EJ77_9BILA